MVSSAAEPVVGVVEQFVEGAAAMVAGHRFVEVPPDAFDGIGGGSVGRQEVQLQALAPAALRPRDSRLHLFQLEADAALQLRP
jgi:hypothetical protein